MFARIVWNIAHTFNKIYFVKPLPLIKTLWKPSRLTMLLLIQMMFISSGQQFRNYSFKNGKKENFQIQPNFSFYIPEEIKKKAQKQKMILVMDLDETLVQTRKSQKPGHQNYQQVDIGDDIIYVEYRPYLKEFLKAASQIFTIYIYTAGTQLYADRVIDSIENHEVISRRFYRQDCFTYRGNIIKDLKKIRKQVEKGDEKFMILVDDNSYSTSYNHPNSIRIKGFSGDQEDKSLPLIFAKLLTLYIKEIDG